MVVIRLARWGAKKKPFYRVVVIDQRKNTRSDYIEKLGYFNPVAQGKAVKLEINLDRIDHWIGMGAQMSDRVASLVKQTRKAKGLPTSTVASKVEKKTKASSDAAKSTAPKKAPAKKAPAKKAATTKAKTTAESKKKEA